VFFKTSVLLQVWGTFANVILEVFFSFGVVFLVILGTMRHFSLGVKKTLLSISCHLLLFVCVHVFYFFFFRKKKKIVASLLIGMSYAMPVVCISLACFTS
jgi:hypothetical protein